MNSQEIEDKVVSSSRIEGWVAAISFAVAVIGYFAFPQFHHFIGWAGLLVWGIYAVLYLFQVGPGRSWLGAFLPGCVAFLFAIWFIRG